MLFILANTYADARAWALMRKIPRSDWVYANTSKSIRGYRRGTCTYTELPGAYRHPNNHIIISTLRSYDFKEVKYG